MEKQEIIELLRKDMAGEHQAIIQYLFHAYALGEGEVAAEIEAIAREEMHHLDWLADAIVELGGDPNMHETLLISAKPCRPSSCSRMPGWSRWPSTSIARTSRSSGTPSLQRLLSAHPAR